MAAPALRRLRNFWRNFKWLLRGRRPGGPLPQPKRKRTRPGPPRVEFSYTIFWTKQARQWDATRRRAVAAALEAVLGQPGFEANDYQRRYRVEGLDEQGHAGASLLALKKVLEAMGHDA
jgi:hypothetical protein